MSRLPFRSRSPRHSQPPPARHHHSSSTGYLDIPTSSQPQVHRSLSANFSGHSSFRGMQRLEARRQMEESNFLSSKARLKNLNPPVDLRALDYVLPCDQNLTCAICRCPFVEPIVLAECDHCFCRDCIRQSWAATYNSNGPRGDCPACRTPSRLGPRSATSKILVNILDDLLVRCPKSEDGCKAQIKRGEVHDHINIYCGYAFMECTAEHCDFPVRRKDASQGCLHYGVSCLDCQESMQKCNLESHWKSQCPDRKISCPMCKEDVLYREFEMHSKETCCAISFACPGQSIGCTVRSRRARLNTHAKDCTFAKLAPIIEAQSQRLDEQECAQKTLNRKLEVLENGFDAMQRILYPRREDPDASSADERNIPFLERMPSMGSGFEPGFSDPAEYEVTDLPPMQLDIAPANSDDEYVMPPTFSRDTEPLHFPPPASPLHHLLSMHESLRDEVTRVSAALQELDGRQSMQTLNENMRTREEMSYLSAQMAGLSRQVHWLTLQSSTRGTSSDMAAASAGVDAAVNAVGAFRGVVAGGSQGMRRGHSEEGRTKL